MLLPRLTNCSQCQDIPSLLEGIECTINKLAIKLYNNTVFILNSSIDGEELSDLLNYKRILIYKFCNPEYAGDYTVNMIASKIKKYIVGCNSPCYKFNYLELSSSTTTTTTVEPTTITTTTTPTTTTTTEVPITTTTTEIPATTTSTTTLEVTTTTTTVAPTTTSTSTIVSTTTTTAAPATTTTTTAAPFITMSSTIPGISITNITINATPLAVSPDYPVVYGDGGRVVYTTTQYSTTVVVSVTGTGDPSLISVYDPNHAQQTQVYIGAGDYTFNIVDFSGTTGTGIHILANLIATTTTTSSSSTTSTSTTIVTPTTTTTTTSNPIARVGTAVLELSVTNVTINATPLVVSPNYPIIYGSGDRTPYTIEQFNTTIVVSVTGVTGTISQVLINDFVHAPQIQNYTGAGDYTFTGVDFTYNVVTYILVIHTPDITTTTTTL